MLEIVINDVGQLRVTMEQMERLFRAHHDLKANLLPQNPELFATMVEGPLDDLTRLREEISSFVQELKPSA